MRLEDITSETQIQDPATGNIITVGDFKNIYGDDLFKKCFNDLNSGNFIKEDGSRTCSPDLLDILRRINKYNGNNRITDYTPTFKREEGYFLRIWQDKIRDENYRQDFKGPETVYNWLWANIVRSGWVDKPGFPIKKNYYDKGLLVYCTSYDKLAKDTFYSKKTLIKMIEDFVKKDIIRIDHLPTKGKKNGQTVFILGEWDGNGKTYQENFFRDKVYGNK